MRTAEPATITHRERMNPMDTSQLADILARHQIYSETWTAPGGVTIVCVCTEVIFVPSPDKAEYETQLNEAFAGHQALKVTESLESRQPEAAAA